MAKAWVYQDDKQVKKYGEEKASWYVGWFDPGGKRRGKSCGAGLKGRRTAEKLCETRKAELLTGTYKADAKKTRKDFRADYESKVLAGLATMTRASMRSSLDAFERHARPKNMVGITTSALADFVAARRRDPGKKKGSTVSPHTVNHDLRHVKAALGVAVEWGSLTAMPKFRMEKAPKGLPTYVTGDHFAAIYTACDRARMPGGFPFTAGDWWRGLVSMGYMTGWRISDMLGLRRADLDLEAGTAVTRAADNKAKRDERVKLHPVVVDHLRKLASFDPSDFPWHHHTRTLRTIFAEVQESAGIRLDCGEAHGHTRFCHVYGFHDLRRSFATMNADKLTSDALQALMRHKSYQTTQVYINMARQMNAAVASLHVPEILRKPAVKGEAKAGRR